MLEFWQRGSITNFRPQLKLTLKYPTLNIQTTIDMQKFQENDKNLCEIAQINNYSFQIMSHLFHGLPQNIFKENYDRISTKLKPLEARSCWEMEPSHQKHKKLRKTDQQFTNSRELYNQESPKNRIWTSRKEKKQKHSQI